MNKLADAVYGMVPYFLGFALVIGTVGTAVGFSSGEYLIATILMFLCIGVGFLYRTPG